MLANHTSIRHLFNRCLSQYDKLIKRKAFIDKYQQFPMFSRDGQGLDFMPEEFDNARAILHALSEEYEACEHGDYVSGEWAVFHRTVRCSAALCVCCPHL